MAFPEATAVELPPLRYRWLPIALGGTAAGAVFLALLFHVGGQNSANGLAYGAQLAAGLFATYCCVAASRRLDGGQRWAWVCVGGIVLVQALGVAVDGYVAVILHHSPLATSGSSLAALASIPFAIGAAVFLLGAHFELSKLRTILDGLIVCMSAFFIAWSALIGELVFKSLKSSGSLSADMNVLASPFADAVYVVAAAILVMQSQKSERRGFWFLAGALAFNQVADLGANYWTHGANQGQWYAALWLAAYVCVGLAAIHALPARKRISDSQWAERSSFLPYVAVGAAVMSALIEPLVDPPDARQAIDPVLFGAGVVMLAILAVRQSIGLQENRRLAQNLREQADVLRGSEARFRSLVQNSSDAIVVLDGDGLITYVSPTADSIFGTPHRELIKSPLVTLLHPDDQAGLVDHLAHINDVDRNWAWIQFRTRDSSGQWRHLEAVPTNLLKDPNVRGIVLNARDVTDRRKLEDQLRHQAFHDPLTMLANRALFHDRVERALLHMGRQDDMIAVLFVDLDDFKNINDTLGHATGDKLLAQLGQRIAASLRTMDTAARLGGDEFAVLLERGVTDQDAVGVAHRILEAIREPIVIDETPLGIGASIGIAMGDSRFAADDLLRRADVAMYQAKNAGKGGYAIFDDSMDLMVVARLQFEVEMHHAITESQLIAHYQPIIDTVSGRIDGVEALVRWQHPQRGLLPPSEFVELAEETGQIVQLGQYILNLSCQEAVRWRRPDGTGPYISVNISPKHFQNRTLVYEVEEALRTSGLRGDRLVIEVTETALLADVHESRRQMEKLREMHVRVALDDFGTGYSSLGYLRELPVDVLKIDRSFVTDLGTSEQPAEFLRAIHTLSTSLRLETIAEGVEDEVQLGMLRALGIRLAQGYLFSRPVAREAIEALIARGGFDVRSVRTTNIEARSA